MPLTPQEAEERQRRLVSSARQQGHVWVLIRDGGFANFTDDDSTVIPVWAIKEDAERCAACSFPGYETHLVRLAEFVQDVLSLLAARAAWVAVNPTEDLGGIHLPAGRLAEVLCDDGV